MRNAALIAALFQFFWMTTVTAYEPVTYVGSRSMQRIDALSLLWVDPIRPTGDAKYQGNLITRCPECAIEVGTFLREAPGPAPLFTAEEQFSEEELDKQAARSAAMANEVVFVSGGVEYRR